MDRHHNRNPAPSTRLELEIESPPLVFYGQPSVSTGALLSGQVKAKVDAEEGIEVEGFEMRFVLDYNCKKPFHAHCPECSKQTVVCTSWKFLQGPTKLAQGMFTLSLLGDGGLRAVC